VDVGGGSGLLKAGGPQGRLKLDKLTERKTNSVKRSAGKKYTWREWSNFLREGGVQIRGGNWWEGHQGSGSTEGLCPGGGDEEKTRKGSTGEMGGGRLIIFPETDRNGRKKEPLNTVKRNR